MVRRITKTKFYSKKIGKLSKGTEFSLAGKKLILSVTGLSSPNTPSYVLADSRKINDSVWANEWKVDKKQDVLEEARLCAAAGVAITGGDPLMRIDRTITYIGMLKNEFGKDFHVQLHAPLALVTASRLRRLHEAGVDEIRLHPDPAAKKEWKKVREAKKFKWDTGVEIPVLPGKEKETIALIDLVSQYVEYVHINELELAEHGAALIRENKVDAAELIKHASEEPTEVLKHCAKTKLNIHYSTVKMRDAVELQKRIQRRAKNVAKRFDRVTKKGVLVRGAIYMKSIQPSFDYHIKLETVNKREVLKRLYRVKKNLQAKYKVMFNEIEVDSKKLRVLTSAKVVKKIAKGLKEDNLVPTVVEEYPTYDNSSIDIKFL